MRDLISLANRPEAQDQPKQAPTTLAEIGTVTTDR